MLAPSRHDAILGALAERGTVMTAELADQLGVSVDTVRRDLLELEAAGRSSASTAERCVRSPGKRRFVDRAQEDTGGKAVVGALGARAVQPARWWPSAAGRPRWSSPTGSRPSSARPSSRRASTSRSRCVTSPSVDVDRARRPAGPGVADARRRRDRRRRSRAAARRAARRRVLDRPRVGLTMREREEAQVMRAIAERSRQGRRARHGGEARDGRAARRRRAHRHARQRCLRRGACAYEQAESRSSAREPHARHPRGLRGLHPQRLHVRELGVTDSAGPRQPRAQSPRSSASCCSRSRSARSISMPLAGLVISRLGRGAHDQRDVVDRARPAW